MSASEAVERLIGGTVIDRFMPETWGCVGRLCEITPVGVEELSSVCRRGVHLPYLDVQGHSTEADIRRVAIVAGEAGNVAFCGEADRLGADCLVAGAVTSKIDNDLGRQRQQEIERCLPTTGLVALGLSHAGSEFVVMRDVAPIIEAELGVAAEAMSERHWWR